MVWELSGLFFCSFLQIKVIPASLYFSHLYLSGNHPMWRAHCCKHRRIRAGMTEMETGDISFSAGVWAIPAEVIKRISLHLWECGSASFDSWRGRALGISEIFSKLAHLKQRALGSWEPKQQSRCTCAGKMGSILLLSSHGCNVCQGVTASYHQAYASRVNRQDVQDKLDTKSSSHNGRASRQTGQGPIIHI